MAQSYTTARDAASVRSDEAVDCLPARGIDFRRHDPVRHYLHDRRTYMIVTGDPTSPAWYVTLTSIVTAVAMWAIPETRHRALAG
jgi:hypothetical protein